MLTKASTTISRATDCNVKTVILLSFHRANRRKRSTSPYPVKRANSNLGCAKEPRKFPSAQNYPTTHLLEQSHPNNCAAVFASLDRHQACDHVTSTKR